MKTEINNLIRDYSLAVLTKNADKCNRVVKSLHDVYNKHNVCVQSKLTSCYVSFRGQPFTLSQFADFFRVPPIVFVAVYDEYGSEIEMYLRYSGRSVLQSRGTVHDKEEFGNRYHIPWLLLDQYAEDQNTYKFLLDKYSEYSRQVSPIGNMSTNSGSKAFAAQAKVKKEFDSFVKQYEERNSPSAGSRRQPKSDKPISATQAGA